MLCNMKNDIKKLEASKKIDSNIYHIGNYIQIQKEKFCLKIHFSND